MKKRINVALALTLLVTMLASCVGAGFAEGGETPVQTVDTPTQTQETPVQTVDTPT